MKTFESFTSFLQKRGHIINESAKEAQSTLDEYVKKYQVSSYVCYVYKDGSPVFESMANADMDSVFGLGSVSKAIDKIAIMKLVETGKIKLTDKIMQFGLDVPKDGINLVNYLDWDGWEAITIDHLLRHKSGIPDIINDIPDFNYHYGEYGKVEDPDKLMVLRAVSKYPLKFKPGTGDNYSNTNFWLIAKIIEHVSGKSYGAAIKELIFEPLGMNNTYWAYDSTNPKGLVKSYVLDQESNKLIDKFKIKPFDAWAIFYSTPLDMKKLAEAYLGGTIISKETRDSFFDSGDNSPGQIGAIHDGFQCFWDAIVDQNCFYLLMINVFGQTAIDPMVDAMVKIRQDVGIKVS